MKTNKEKFNIKYGQDSQASNSISKIAKLSGISKSILQEVYNRGVGAWKTNPASVRTKSGKKDPTAPISQKMSKEAWAMARVYSFITGGKTQKTTDSDLWKKHKSKK
ncbi:MAG: DUF5824 family protein [Cyanophyceae cyanobacterium]